MSDIMDVTFHGYGPMRGARYESDMVEPEDGEGFSPRPAREARPSVFSWCDPHSTPASHARCHGWFVAHAVSANHKRGDLVMCECPTCQHEPPDPIPDRPIHGRPAAREESA